jgi:hypothetical protein
MTVETRSIPPSVSRRLFIGGSVAAVAASSLAGTAAAAQASPLTSLSGADSGATGLKAGAGKAVIKITSAMLPSSDGFTTVHDELYVRVLLLENGSAHHAVIVLDTTSVNDPTVLSGMRAIVTTVAGVPAANTLITVTHNFSSPHLNGTTGLTGTQLAKAKLYREAVLDAATSAVTDAFKTLRSARVGYGTGRADVNVNRNVLTAQGWWLGTGEQGPSDKSVRVTRIDDLSGNPISILINYNVQSSVMMESVMSDGALPVTADLAGAAVTHVEQQYGGTVVPIWLVGACGDQAPAFRSLRYTIDKNLNWSTVDARDAGWLLLTLQGERLGTEVVRVAQAIDTATAPAGSTLRLVTSSFTATQIKQSATNQGPTKTDTCTPDGTSKVPVWVLQLGDGAFVGLEPELSTETALAIAKASPFQHTNVMSMLEGGAKNMPDSWNYDHITYEALDSFYAKGTAEKAVGQASQLLNSLRS